MPIAVVPTMALAIAREGIRPRMLGALIDDGEGHLGVILEHSPGPTPDTDEFIVDWGGMPLRTVLRREVAGL